VSRDFVATVKKRCRMREEERRFSRGESQELPETEVRSLQILGSDQEDIAAEYYDLSGGSDQSVTVFVAFMKLAAVR
jgi:hypothetical protein